MKHLTRLKQVIKPFFLWSLGSSYLIALFIGVTALLVKLPTPLPLNSHTFSETRAMESMDYLVKTIGARPIDSWKNRNDTVRFLIDKLTEYQQNATRIGHAKLDFRLQQETGGL
jgi:hypothetical protein